MAKIDSGSSIYWGSANITPSEVGKQWVIKAPATGGTIVGGWKPSDFTTTSDHTNYTFTIPKGNQTWSTFATTVTGLFPQTLVDEIDSVSLEATCKLGCELSLSVDELANPCPRCGAQIAEFALETVTFRCR